MTMTLSTEDTQFPRPKLIALDLRKTLIHECGHMIVANWAGVEEFFIEIWLYDDGGPASDSLVGGQSAYFPDLNDRNKQLLGVAGFVAEALADDEIEDIHAEELFDCWEGDVYSLSATDLEAAGQVDEALFGDCAKLLRQHWPDLIAEALRCLGQFEERHVDDDDATEAASSVRVELEGMRDRFLEDQARSSVS